MKRLALVCIGLLLMMPMAITSAQDGDANKISYGDTVMGEVSNRQFEELYTFDGEEGDIVQIDLVSEQSLFDPYLYLTTLDNEIIAQNDDNYSLDSRIIARLPATDTYQIVATRLSGRAGSGGGPFSLTLQEMPAVMPGITVEGQTRYDEVPAAHVFVPETSGIYTITYRHIRGNYYPGLKVSTFTPGYSYEEEIANLSGRELTGGQLTMAFDADTIYIFSVEQDYYNYSDSGSDMALYTLIVEAAVEE